MQIKFNTAFSDIIDTNWVHYLLSILAEEFQSRKHKYEEEAKKNTEKYANSSLDELEKVRKHIYIICVCVRVCVCVIHLFCFLSF